MKRRICREWIVTLLGSLLYAAMYAIGSLIYYRDTCDPLRMLTVAACAFPVFALCLRVLFKGRRTHRADGVHAEKTFSPAAAFVLIMTGFVLFYILVYPGTFMYDSHVQLHQVHTQEYSSHHPLLHTLLFGFCMKLLPVLGSYQNCAAAYAIVQMTAMAAMYTLVCTSIARFAGAGAARLASLFYSLYPMHMCFASHMTKDSLFSSAFAVLFTLMMEVTVRKKVPPKTLAGIVIFGTLAVALRNNMIYAVLVWLLFFPALMKTGYGKKLAAGVLFAALLGMGTLGALQNTLDAEPGNKREMLSWPAQQLARAWVYTGERFTEEEQKLLDELIMERRYEQYQSNFADKVKNWINTDVLLDNLKDYVSMYVSVGKKCPQQYIDAVAALIYPYIYPYPEYEFGKPYIEMGINDYGFDYLYGEGCVEQNPVFENVRLWMNEHIWINGATHIPVLRWMLNPGLISWVMLFFVIKQAHDGHWQRFIVCLLPVLLWGTYLLGPIMNGRYIYVFVCILPALWSRERGRDEERNGYET